MPTLRFNNPFRHKGLWFKGNLHSHTTVSDGKLTPKQLVYLYKNRGYSFLALTDHNKISDTSHLTSEEFLVIPGIEVDVDKALLGEKYHIVGIGIKEEIKPSTAQEAIDLIRELGGLAWVAHPYWSMLTFHDLIRLEGYIAIEVFNTTCHVIVDKGFSITHWDQLLTYGRYVYGLAVDDVHWNLYPHTRVDALMGWVMVKAESLDYDSIMKSIEQGLFYSTMGPVIKDLRIEGDEVFVECSPVERISFIQNHYRGKVFMASEGYITSASYKVRKGDKYIRVECITKDGRKAWTNPIIVEW